MSRKDHPCSHPKGLSPLVLAVLVVSLFSHISIAETDDAQGLGSLEAMKPYAEYLNELSDRRRSVVHIPNQQSIFRGVQVGFVNVGDGNLTFVRRDLVTVGLLPIVVARIYDSSSPGSKDFGSGWRLSIAEEVIPQRDGSVNLVDETASLTRFVKKKSGFVPIQPRPTDIEVFRQDSDRSLVIKLTSGITKRYQLIDDRFKLQTIQDRNGNLIRMRYANGAVVRIEASNKRYVEITRDDFGRIAAIVDDQNRSVAYEYIEEGSLSQVTDLGGNAWSYEYDAAGRLIAALDPMRNIDISARYDDDGRVDETVNRGDIIDFEYAPRTTTVLDGLKRFSTFTQDENGITTSITNAAGINTRLELDERNRVSGLIRDSVLTASFSHDTTGRLHRMTQFGEAQTGLTYRYDRAGRLTTITNDVGLTKLSLRYDPRGNVTLVRYEEDQSRYRYNRNGALRALDISGTGSLAFDTDSDGQIVEIKNSGGEVTELAYNMAGRLTRVSFSDGTSQAFDYDDVGLRTSTQPSDANLMRYFYSGVGNLHLLEHAAATGETLQDQYEIDATNRVTGVKYDDGAVSMEYDDRGEHTRLIGPLGTLNFEYDGQSRLTGVKGDEVALRHDYEHPDERDIRLQADATTRVTLLPAAHSGSTIGSSFEILLSRTRQVPYGTVYFDGYSSSFLLASSVGNILPNSSIEATLNRIRLRDLIADVASRKWQFTSPSNALFVPAEFWSVNCRFCLPQSVYIPGGNLISEGIIVTPNAPCPGGGGGGGGGGFNCATNTVDTAAKTWLTSFPLREPFERGAALLCSGTTASIGNITMSGSDPCATTITATATNAVAGAHTHPWFDNATEADGCRGIPKAQWTDALITGQNNANKNFSDNDEAWVTGNGKPLYLRISSSATVKVRETTGSERTVP